MAGHAGDGALVEEVPTVFQRGPQPGPGLDHHQGEVEFRRFQVERQHLDGKVLQLDARHLLGTLQRQRHLEERRAAEIAVGPQLVDQAFKGQVLVGIGAQRRFSDALQQLTEARIASAIRAEHQGIDEEADHCGGLAPAPTGQGRTDQDVALPRVAREEQGERREQGHEQGDARVAAQRLERFPQGQREDVPAAAKRLDRRPRAVGREGEG